MTASSEAECLLWGGTHGEAWCIDMCHSSVNWTKHYKRRLFPEMTRKSLPCPISLTMFLSLSLLWLWGFHTLSLMLSSAAAVMPPMFNVNSHYWQWQANPYKIRVLMSWESRITAQVWVEDWNNNNFKKPSTPTRLKLYAWIHPKLRKREDYY